MTAEPVRSFDGRTIAEDVARLVSANYVFPEHAATISELLSRRSAAGDYDSEVDLAGLAALLTHDLQSVNGDRHLRVIHTDEPVVDLDDEDAELAMWASRADDDAGGVANAEIFPGDLGYLELRPILYPAVLVGDWIAAALTLVADAAALIVDVRNCVGGSPDTVALVCSYLFDEESVQLSSMVDRSGAEVQQSWTLAHVPGHRFGSGKPVVVLTSGTTFSGAEELAYDLQQLGRARVIGEQTGGGANPREGFRVHSNLEATIPVARSVNPISGTNWEQVGVTPDIAVASDVALECAVQLLVGEHTVARDNGGGQSPK
jgi:Peptidase family S41/N-terminal domain of Peptidase_S41 in eukaryotic IRBP